MVHLLYNLQNICLVYSITITAKWRNWFHDSQHLEQTSVENVALPSHDKREAVRCFASCFLSPDFLAALSVLTLVDGWGEKTFLRTFSQTRNFFKALLYLRELSERALRELPIFNSAFQRRLTSFLCICAFELTIIVPQHKLQDHQSWLNTSSIQTVSQPWNEATGTLFLTCCKVVVFSVERGLRGYF